MSSDDRRERIGGGALGWMAGNSVAANLLMFMLIIGGIIMAPSIKQEVFPEFTLDIITVQVPYPGASPAEVEQGVLLAVEEAVRGIDGVKEVRSTAMEGMASITVELLLGANTDVALSDVQSAVDRITSLPQDAERPVVSLVASTSRVVDIVIYGDATEQELRDVANDARDGLLLDDRVTNVELVGVRPLEISIEVPEEELRRYGFTLPQIAQIVSNASIELPAGGLKTDAGEMLLRTTERRDIGEEYEDITVLATPDGSEIRLGQIADVRDGFEDNDQAAFFNGERAVIVRAYRVGEETPIEVSDAAKEFVAEWAPDLPPNLDIQILNDDSEMYRGRMQLLVKNAMIGLVLVLLVLGVFLEIKLAFWVTLGIPITFIGALLFMPTADASLNMISLFAFILTLGIVVDDAIVVGESIYHQQQKLGKTGLRAAVDGVLDVAGPVTFSVTTTMIAFSPLLFVPGMMGKFMIHIPIIVILVLALSLVESLLILPAHLAHNKGGFRGGLLGMVSKAQAWFSDRVDAFIRSVYVPTVRPFLKYRYATLGFGFAVLMVAFGTVKGGILKRTFLPRIESDVVSVSIEMPVGTPVNRTEEVANHLIEQGIVVLERNGGVDALSLGHFVNLGVVEAGGGPGGMSSSSGGHMGQVVFYLLDIDERDISTAAFVRQWREAIGDVAGVERIGFDFATGASSGAPIDIELSHSDVEVLERAAADLAEQLGGYAGVTDINDGFSPGKVQLDLQLTERGRANGLTEIDLARQVRAAFYGAEAVRQQRGRDEVRVFVRRPEAERSSESDFESMMITTPSGAEMPLLDAATVDRGRAYTSITRQDGRRVVNVTADIDEQVANANEIVGSLREEVLPPLLDHHRGVSWSLAGEQQDQAESLGALQRMMGLALIAMYGLLAIAFRSYIQPVIIMTAIPFGFVGAAIGHLALGYNLSIMSMFGLVALSGVVVNDSLVLITAVNRYREEGMTPMEAAIEGGARRFRPIMLTSLTTFFGLAPMIVETSLQARFLIPMAISLGFGVLLVTVIALGLVPAIYLIVEDVKWLFGRLTGWLNHDVDVPAEAAPPGE